MHYSLGAQRYTRLPKGKQQARNNNPGTTAPTSCLLREGCTQYLINSPVTIPTRYVPAQGVPVQKFDQMIGSYPCIRVAPHEQAILSSVYRTNQVQVLIELLLYKYCQ